MEVLGHGRLAGAVILNRIDESQPIEKTLLYDGGRNSESNR